MNEEVALYPKHLWLIRQAGSAVIQPLVIANASLAVSAAQHEHVRKALAGTPSIWCRPSFEIKSIDCSALLGVAGIGVEHAKRLQTERPKRCLFL